MSVPEILWPAQRQYRHNTGDDSLIGGFELNETIKIVATLQARIDKLEILNNGLNDLYNKHMRSWAERETAQDSLLDEGKALIVRLIQYIRNPDKKRMNTTMLINYSTMMEEADSLIDRIRNRKNGGKEE